MITFIFEKEKIAALLDKLQPDTPARWGLMTAQHMVEHLGMPIIMALQNMRVSALLIPEEKVAKAQASLEDPTREIPQMLRPPYFPADELMPLRFPDLPTAKNKLLQRVDEFNTFWEAQPDALRFHPFFGEMGKKHWILFQNKHFYHHFKQFGLVD